MEKDYTAIMAKIREQDPNFSVKGFMNNKSSQKCKSCGGENGIHKSDCQYMAKYINNDK